MRFERLHRVEQQYDFLGRGTQWYAEKRFAVVFRTTGNRQVHATMHARAVKHHRVPHRLQSAVTVYVYVALVRLLDEETRGENNRQKRSTRGSFK